MREQINSQIKEAMKAKDSKRLMTLRLITAAIKDYDIAVRSDGNYDGATDQQVLQILAKMIKQRKESATQYANANRPELGISPAFGLLSAPHRLFKANFKAKG